MKHDPAEIISHLGEAASLSQRVNEVESSIRARDDLTEEETAEALGILGMLTEFELGRFLLLNRGLNGRWTHRVVHEHPSWKRAEGEHYLDRLHPLERILLDGLPTFRATQERFEIFQRTLKPLLKDKARLCSLPCGLMADFLTLDLDCSPYSFFGADLDLHSLQLARELASSKGIRKTEFRQVNAWEFEDAEGFDVILSNGLNIYVSEEEKELELYRVFHRALKPGGSLITSFLTPPPALSADSEWRTGQIDAEMLRTQKMIFSVILGVKWQNYRSSNEIRRLLQSAGFQNVQVHWDHQGIFPTVIAQK